MSIPKDAEKIARMYRLSEEAAQIDASYSHTSDFANFRQSILPSSSLSDALKRPETSMPLTADVLASVRVFPAADDGPPSNNMGGNPLLPPQDLPRCEKSTYLSCIQKTKVDWMAFTTLVELEAVKLGVLVIWTQAVFAVRSSGVKGYPQALDIIVDDVHYGLIGYGAKHGRNWVSITGVGASTISHVDLFNVYEMLYLIDARLTRLDIALDFYHGELTWDHAERAYEHTDQFSSRAGGKKPRASTVKGVDCDGKNTGRTLYIGQRGESEKFIRIYEKGLEVFAKLPKDLRDASDSRALVFSIDDSQFADNWLRIEVEFARQKRDLPLEMLLQRDEYFAGTCSYLANAVGIVDGLRPESVKDKTMVDLIKLIGNGRRSYGSVIHTLKELGFTDTEVVQHMSSGKLNNKLVKSGMLSTIKIRQVEILSQMKELIDRGFFEIEAEQYLSFLRNKDDEAAEILVQKVTHRNRSQCQDQDIPF